MAIITSTKKKIFIFLGADYGNLGDVAITYAQINWLRTIAREYEVIEIPISKTFAGIKAVKKIITADDIITLIGGGNTSDLYDDIEFLRQLVIFNFRKYRIIGFPQTVDFSHSRAGLFTQWTVKQSYRMATHFTFISRESKSASIIQSLLPSIEHFCAPDIVMTLDKRRNYSRKGLLICLRADKERLADDTIRTEVIEHLSNQFSSNVTFQDTQIPNVNYDNRFEQLDSLLDKISHHQVMLTDRLHGMIFAFITGTPAYVFDNANHKISECYKWIEECKYIKLINSIDDITPIQYSADNFTDVHNSIIERFTNIPCLKFQ